MTRVATLATGLKSVHLHVLLSLVDVVQFEEGLLSREVSNEEPMKVALCVLLQHLCDCQVRYLKFHEPLESGILGTNGFA